MRRPIRPPRLDLDALPEVDPVTLVAHFGDPALARQLIRTTRNVAAPTRGP